MRIVVAFSREFNQFSIFIITASAHEFKRLVSMETIYNSKMVSKTEYVVVRDIDTCIDKTRSFGVRDAQTLIRKFREIGEVIIDPPFDEILVRIKSMDWVIDELYPYI